MRKNILWGVFIFILTLFVSCDDDDDPFTGSDNFITSFSLRQGENSYHALLRGDTIILTTPEGVVLSEVTPEIACSENCSIKPDPSTITNWDEQIYFVITSYNGAERKYIYIPEKQYISFEGIVMLNTQEEVDAFGAKGLTQINGSLIIGRQTGLDTIHSLEALSSLKSVTNDVIINRLFSGYELTGLDNLEDVGGKFQVYLTDSLWNVTLNHLERVGGDFSVTSNAISEILCPHLETVGGALTFESGSVTVDFSSLRQISGDLTLNGKVAMNGIVFPSLERVGGAISVTMSSLKKLEFPVLRSCDKLSTNRTGALTLLYTPLLEEITTELNLGNNPLYEVSFPVLTHIGTVMLNCPQVNQFNAPALKTVDNNFDITLAGANPEQFAALESVGGTFTLNFTLDEFKFPAKLKKLGTLVINSGIKRLDIRGIEINEIQFNGTGLENTTLVGDNVFNGTFSLQNLGGYFPKLEGFRELKELNIGYLSMGGNTLEIAGVRKINENFSYWANSNVSGILLTDLEEVCGDFELFSNIKTFHFPKLKTIGGNATISINDYDNESFPLLQSVGGNMIFGTGYQDNWGSYGPEKVLYSALRTVGGILDIRPAAPSPWGDNQTAFNKKLDNLDFLSGLESIGGFRLVNHEAMVSYEGLKKAISTCPASKWQVEGNGYNPTYEELANQQQWTKPE
ncbi:MULTISPECIES: hypothetical protein [Butyricimonas]|uniref:hypothetical protein n=1 Tax=Butyricimonas TaxID=574697 RepID=UPI0007FB2097|nr:MULTISPECIES: hypothetical protein [Butyricimonas]